MIRSRPANVLFLVLLSSSAAAAGGEAAPPSLSVERIFAGHEFDTRSFSGTWLRDGSGYVTLENAQSGGGKEIVVWDPETGERETLVSAAQLIPPGESAPLAIEAYSFSPNRARVLIYTNSRRVWRRNTRGDYWVLDRAARTLHRLGGDAPPSSLMFAKLAPIGDLVAYVRDKNLYLEDLHSHEITALTKSASPEIINGTFDWVYEEELGLRDGFSWSPDATTIAFWQLDTSGVPEFTLIDNTSQLYPKLQRFAYPKVGQQNAAARLGILDLRSRQTRWLAIPGDPRQHYLARMQWAGNSNRLLIQQLNRLQNTNRVLLADTRSGAVTTVLVEQDKAWVDIHDELFWLDGGRRFTWISERDGWRRAYRVALPLAADPAAGSSPGGSTLGSMEPSETPQPINSGSYDVIELLRVDGQQSEDRAHAQDAGVEPKDASAAAPGGFAYFLASPDNATQRYLYRSQLDGGGLQRLTPDDEPGCHQYEISPCGRWAFHSWSSFGTPPRHDLVRLPGHERVRMLEDNKQLAEKLGALRPAHSEFFRVPAGDVTLDAWCIEPPKREARKKYPLLVYVYGEPAGQTVLDRWGGSNYLWHRILAERGYVVMSFDNRGTPAPRGREWRKSIYRQVGILAPADQAAALRAVLDERPYLDAERVGIWGWSGGGSMSLHAIFQYPQLYKTAIAVAPVANMRLYDTIYQERYMGLPEENTAGYLKGSPIEHAHQLKGNLLIVHGTGDDNCHYQATETLIDELIRHNKPFRMMAYPNRSHAIHEGRNTTRHLRELLTTYLAEHLPEGPK